MADQPPKHYVPLSGIGGIWGDANTEPYPRDWQWHVEKVTNASGHFSDPDAECVAFRYEFGASTLDVTIVWAQTWLKPKSVTIYDLDEDQDLSKVGLDALAAAILAAAIKKNKPPIKEYAHEDNPITKKSDREHAYRFNIENDFKLAGLIISAHFERSDTAPGLTHDYTAVIPFSVTALPALHFYLGDSYWFSLMQDDDSEAASGKKYLIYSEEDRQKRSYIVSKPDGTQASLMNGDTASALGTDDIAFFGMLAPLSIFRQMGTPTKELGEQFLAREFNMLTSQGSLSGMISFHGSSLVLFGTAWKGIQGMLPLANDGIGRLKTGLNTFLDPNKPPLERLYGLGTVVYEVGDTLLALFPEAVAEVGGKIVFKAVAVTAAELKSAMQSTVKVLSEQSKEIIALLEELKTVATTLVTEIDRNIKELKALIAQVEGEVVTLGPKIDAIPPAQLSATWSSLGQMGSALWNKTVKRAVQWFEQEAKAGRAEKVAERHFRTKGAKPAIVDPLDAKKVKPGVGTEEAFEQTIWFKDVDQAAVLDAINNASIPPAEKQQLRQFAKDRFAAGKCCRIDHIRIDHTNLTVQIVDKTGSWNFKHRCKTDFYRFVFENCMKNAQNSFVGVQFKKLGYVVRAIEYFWRE